MKKIQIEGRFYSFQRIPPNQIKIFDFDGSLLNRKAPLVSAVCNVFGKNIYVKDIFAYKDELQTGSNRKIKAYRVTYETGDDFLIIYKPKTKTLLIEYLRIMPGPKQKKEPKKGGFINWLKNLFKRWKK